MSNNHKQPGFLAAFFGFKRMVSPVFIRLFYYLGIIGILTGAGAAFIQKGPIAEHLMHSGLSVGGAVGYYIAIVLFALVLILVWRFYCELLIVLFSIFNRLGDISAALNNMAENSPAPVAAVAAPTQTPAKATPKSDDDAEDKKDDGDTSDETSDEKPEGDEKDD